MHLSSGESSHEMCTIALADGSRSCSFHSMQMNAFVARVSVTALCLAACTSGQSGAPADGQAGGGSVDLPCSAEACQEQVEVMLERDLGPRATMRPRFTTGTCVNTASEQGPSGEACQCSDDDSGSVILGPREAGCLVFGHGGTCLWQGQDMPEQCDSEACEMACDEISDRFEADDRVTYPFNLRYATCVNDRCEGVAKIGDYCYSTSQLQWSQAEDCSLSNSQIIENASGDSPGGSTNTCNDVTECSDAYGCRNGVCLWCNDSSQCAANEECVNALCVLTAAIECHSDEDCEASGELCLLFGAEQVGAAPGRGNANLRAECGVPEDL